MVSWSTSRRPDTCQAANLLWEARCPGPEFRDFFPEIWARSLTGEISTKIGRHFRVSAPQDNFAFRLRDLAASQAARRGRRSGPATLSLDLIMAT